MKIRDIMSTNVVTARADSAIGDVARLLTLHRISAVPVVDDERAVIGIVSQRDLFLKERGLPFSRETMPTLFDEWVDPGRLPQVYRQACANPVSEVMSSPAVCVDAEAEVGDVAEMMMRRDLKRVPVLYNGKLVGIVTRADLIRFLVKPVQQLIKEHGWG